MMTLLILLLALALAGDVLLAVLLARSGRRPPKQETAEDFASLLASYELIAKIIRRKESFVVYLASLAAISDFLAVAGAQNSRERHNLTGGERE